MICRSAMFIGTVKPEYRETFKAQIEGPVAQAMLTFPNVRRFEVRWSVDWEEGAPEINFTLEHYYDNQSDLDTAIASDNRTKVWEALNEVMPYFQGQCLHINYEVDIRNPK